MLPMGRIGRRRLVAAAIASAMALIPLTAAASNNTADADALWNQPESVSADSAFYVIQSWWDGIGRATQSDPTQRGLDELAQANADLLSAHSVLLRQRTDPGPHPVAVIDPLLAGIYNLITGSDAKAPVGSVFNWINQSLLNLEGRGSTDEIVRVLLKDYQAKQAAAERDLHSTASFDADALLIANAQRETAFMLKIKAVSSPGDGLAGPWPAIDQSTTALPARHHGNNGGAHRTPNANSNKQSPPTPKAKTGPGGKASSTSSHP